MDASRPAVLSGLDVLTSARMVRGSDGPAAADRLLGRRLGLIAHPASITSGRVHAVDALLESGFDLRTLFGPQHGARGEKQDNMIESDHYADPVTGLPVHSLYSEVRRPTPAMLDGLDALLFDLQDVGTRVYTFIWTMALAMEACAEAGVRFVVLDRPNPVGLDRVEGPVVREGFESFVGLHPLPLRHGLSVGEVALWLNGEGERGGRGIGCDLQVVRCHGLRERGWLWDDAGLPWVLPSPNLPTPESCVVYPGMVLLEGTTLSEGRGTTRPFELFGAPWLEPHRLVERLNKAGLPGVAFRPCSFEPTFQKHAGALCGGAQIHPVGPDFEPVRTGVEVLAAARELAPADFAWREPPYEYEEVLPPIDILWGSPELREQIDCGAVSAEIMAGAEVEAEAFRRARTRFLLYPGDRQDRGA